MESGESFYQQQLNTLALAERADRATHRGAFRGHAVPAGFVTEAFLATKMMPDGEMAALIVRRCFRNEPEKDLNRGSTRTATIGHYDPEAAVWRLYPEFVDAGEAREVEGVLTDQVPFTRALAITELASTDADISEKDYLGADPFHPFTREARRLMRNAMEEPELPRSIVDKGRLNSSNFRYGWDAGTSSRLAKIMVPDNNTPDAVQPELSFTYRGLLQTDLRTQAITRVSKRLPIGHGDPIWPHPNLLKAGVMLPEEWEGLLPAADAMAGCAAQEPRFSTIFAAMAAGIQ
jgi:hypothetical protein